MGKIYVIAGHRAQGEDWIKRDLQRRLGLGVTTLSRSEYVYINDAQQLQGIKNPHGVFVGAWRDRTDIKYVVELLIRASRFGGDDTTLRKIYDEL